MLMSSLEVKFTFLGQKVVQCFVLHNTNFEFARET